MHLKQYANVDFWLDRGIGAYTFIKTLLRDIYFFIKYPYVIWNLTVITVFTVFRLLTDFVCLYNCEFWLSLYKIVRSSVILLLPLFTVHSNAILNIKMYSYMLKKKMYSCISLRLIITKIKIPGNIVERLWHINNVTSYEDQALFCLVHASI